MASSFWKQIDIVENPPVFLENGDPCLYARDYTSGGGWQASEANAQGMKQAMRTAWML